MVKQVWVTDVPRPSGSDIIVVKLPDGGASSRGLARRVVNAVRSKTPLSEMDGDVIVLDGGAGDPARHRHVGGGRSISVRSSAANRR